MARTFTLTASFVLGALVLSGCSGDVTMSDEYRALEGELSAAIAAQAESETVADQTGAELEQALSDVDEARSEVHDLKDRIRTVQEELTAAEEALEEATDTEWPDEIRSLFETGCVSEAPAGSESEASVFCSCAMDRIEGTYSVEEFLVLSFEAAPSGDEMSLFDLSPDSNPEFLKNLNDLVVDCAIDAQATSVKSSWDLRVGDCFADPPSLDVIETLAMAPCSGVHDNEVYAVVEMPADAWPGEDAVQEWADSRCMELFERYVGMRWEASELDYWYLFPLEESWTKYDDRDVACVLYDPRGEGLAGTLEGTEA